MTVRPPKPNRLFVMGTAGVIMASFLMAVAMGAASAGASTTLQVGKTYSGAPPIPALRACHARGVLADPNCTPAATNPVVTQADIGSTICKPGWSESVRPPESYTEPLKRRLMGSYGDTSPIGSYELDHLVSLELGGAPSDPQPLARVRALAQPEGQRRKCCPPSGLRPSDRPHSCSGRYRSQLGGPRRTARARRPGGAGAETGRPQHTYPYHYRSDRLRRSLEPVVQRALLQARRVLPPSWT